MPTVQFKGFPSDSEHTVAGIKAIRAMTGLGLKEAKAIIDGLKEGVETDWMEISDREALQTFISVGGWVNDGNDGHIKTLQGLMVDAMESRSYVLAQDVLDLLKKHG